MDELLDLKSRMEQERPAEWENLPDIALYMDQLISYMPRQLIHFDENEALTSAMATTTSRTVWSPGPTASGTAPSTWAISPLCQR